jgi:hypothetical protein
VPLYVAQLAQVIATPNSTAFAYFQEYVVLSSVVCVAFATSAFAAHSPAPRMLMASASLGVRVAEGHAAVPRRAARAARGGGPARMEEAAGVSAPGARRALAGDAVTACVRRYDDIPAPSI